MSGSSIVPSTREWLASICSMRVEPARGIPRMKIGSLARQRRPERASKKAGVNKATLRSTWRSISPGS
jgi:hypothetical protein